MAIPEGLHPPAHTDMTVAEPLTREEREVLSWLRQQKKSGRVGACVIFWDRNCLRLYPTLPPERVQG